MWMCIFVLSLAVLRGMNSAVLDDGDVKVERRAMVQSAGVQVSTMTNAFSQRVGSVPYLKSVLSESVQALLVQRCLGYSRSGREIQYNESFEPLEKRESKKLANRDFVFLLDTSGSTPESEFNLAKQAIASLLEAFCPLKFGHATTDKGTKQMSMILFGTGVTEVIDFADSHKGLRILQDKIMSIKHRHEGMTRTADALKYVKDNILGKGLSRLNDPKVSTDVIMVTNGRCTNNCQSLLSVADEIRRMGNGVNIFAVGADPARECELDFISGREPQMAYRFKSMASFRTMAMRMRSEARRLPNSCV